MENAVLDQVQDEVKSEVVSAQEVSKETPKDAPPPKAIHPLAHLGVRTVIGSRCYKIDEVLNENVEVPLSGEEIAKASGQDLKFVLLHMKYWMGGQPIGENGWTLKRSKTALANRLTKTEDGKFYLKQE